MMRLSVSTYCLNQLPWQQAARRLAELGYQRVELIAFADERTADVHAWNGVDLVAAVRAMGLDLIAIYPQVINVWDDAKLAATESYVRRAIDLCAEGGIGRIVFTPLLPRPGYDYGKLGESCLRLAEHIGNRPVQICLENHAGWPLDNADDLARMAELVPDRRVGFTLDTGHFTASGVDPVEIATRFADRIYHVHLKDHVGPECVALGKGTTDNRGVLDALRGSGFDGYATLDIEVKDVANTERYLAEARVYCREVLGLE